MEAELAFGLGLVESGSIYGGKAFVAAGDAFAAAPFSREVDVTAVARSLFSEEGLGSVGRSAASMQRVQERVWQQLVIEQQLASATGGIAPEQTRVDGQALLRREANAAGRPR